MSGFCDTNTGLHIARYVMLAAEPAGIEPELSLFGHFARLFGLDICHEYRCGIYFRSWHKAGAGSCRRYYFKDLFPHDKSTYPLFGDAGTATALEYDAGSDSGMAFELAVDGGGSDVIIVPDGGFRNMVSENSFIEKEKSEGIKSNDLQLHLEGMDVFTFGISKAPSIVNMLLEETDADKDSVDYYVFHQANLFMNEKIRKKLKLPAEKVPYSLKDFGNTSCASIPLTMVTEMRTELKDRRLSIVACGFGVGLSWGAIHFITNKIVCPNLIEHNG